MKRAACVLALMTAACASSGGAPIAYGSGAPAPAQAGTQPPRAQPTDPAPNWAAGPGTPLSTFALRPDQAQPFDPANLPRSHRVAGNESLYDIASTYQVPLRALIDQNNLEPPFSLAPGRTLQLPPPRLHRVTQGQTFEDVARQYNVDLRSLALLNRMRPPYLVRAGDQIVLPAMARAQPASAPAPSRAANVAPPPITAPATPRPRASTPAVETTPQPAAPAPTLAWPLRGDVVARFGAQQGGGRVDGIEIAASEGAPIAAAAEGEVVYAGSDLSAYGTLVLVRHANGYVTAYGYARRALVREGQRVRAGQAIGEVGRIGAGEPRLLFQLRRGSEAIDPLPLLGQG